MFLLNLINPLFFCNVSNLMLSGICIQGKVTFIWIYLDLSLFWRVETEETATAELDHQLEAASHSGNTDTILEEEEEEEEGENRVKDTKEPSRIPETPPADNAVFKTPASPTNPVNHYHVDKSMNMLTCRHNCKL